MGFKASGEQNLPFDLGARMRAALVEAGNMAGQAIVKRAKDGMLVGAKSAHHYSGQPNQSSSPGEYSANQTGRLLDSIQYRMSGHAYLSIFATAEHAGSAVILIPPTPTNKH